MKTTINKDHQNQEKTQRNITTQGKAINKIKIQNTSKIKNKSRKAQ